MKKEKILKAIYGSDKNPLKIGNLEIPCYVLEDGTRVLSRRGMDKALATAQSHGQGIKRLLNSSLFKPFINNELEKKIFSPIKFKPPKGSYAIGYEATILTDICNIILQAREKGILTNPKHLLIANHCEILIRGFAHIGIIALIDEITGYQADRNREELQKILQAYIGEHLLKWQKRFPDNFYKEMFRLRGWEYNVKMIQKRPGVIGTWTNKLIYKQLPKGVLEELKNKTPKDEKGRRKHHYHRLLTTDVGHPHLSNQITAVVTLMKASTNWRNFESLFAKAFKTGQQKIEFEEENQ